MPDNLYFSQVALLAEGVDRNLTMLKKSSGNAKSPSSRRAWIEITSCRATSNLCRVALLAEGVDRNLPLMYVAQ